MCMLQRMTAPVTYWTLAGRSLAPRRGKRMLYSTRRVVLTQPQTIPVSHGSYFYYAWKEGLLASNNANIVSLHIVSTPHFN